MISKKQGDCLKSYAKLVSGSPDFWDLSFPKNQIDKIFSVLSFLGSPCRLFDLIVKIYKPMTLSTYKTNAILDYPK
jgi:hypothetical protein